MYDPHAIESKWQRLWSEHRIFEPVVEDMRKFFITVPYPYLNGNLHAGHTRTFTIGDVVARYRRMRGYNVLFPMGFHVTGTPIVGLSELIKNRNPEIMQVYVNHHDIPEEALYNLGTPERIVDYFKVEAERSMRSIGYSIDWRRKFTTMDEHYKAFIRWQFNILHEKGYISKGSHPVRWCPHDDNPVEDHDILQGEEATIVDYALLKFRLEDGTVLPCATLRPETVFGVTNLWLNPSLTYARVVVSAPDGKREEWVVSAEALDKLSHTDREVSKTGEVVGSELIGKSVLNPITDTSVVVLPAEFVQPDEGTGVVMSVPAHAPYDHLALQDLKDRDLSEYGLSENPARSIEYISLIEVAEYGVFPAVEVCEELGVADQHDPRAEDATKLVYRREFHGGVLKGVCGRYAGMSVSDVKDVLTHDLVEQGHAELFHDFSERPVICRCGARCVVKTVRDQWFLNYSDPDWKQLARECLAQMDIVPAEMRTEFENKIEWLKDKACARRKGLGTTLPWDSEWLIESLADSTIYMTYYITVRLRDRGLAAEDITEPVLDYILLGKETLKDVPDQHRAAVKATKEEFEYWYPVDLRSSGKDLIANHLLFFIFHHVAIFPEEKWPRAVAVNGFVSLEGKKMSKSRGPLLTLKRAVSQHGADTTRLYILSNAELMQDADWKSENVQSTGKHLQRFYDWARSIIAEHPKPSNGSRLDRWLLSRLAYHVSEANAALERLQTRKALQHAFFLLLNDVRWYERRGGRAELFTVVDTMLRLMSPFTPHICEELWSLYHEKGEFISLAPYPQPHIEDRDMGAEFCELLVKDVLDDISNILKVAKLENPKSVYVYTAEDWSYAVLREVLAQKHELNVGHLMKRFSLDTEVNSHMKEAAAYLKALARDIHSMEDIKKEGYMSTGWSGDAERELLRGASEFLSGETGLTIVVDVEREEPKAASARPMRPAIIIE
ncbi:MAG: leucine--tRNA ligase [Methermicoccaceae archaeon]